MKSNVIISDPQIMGSTPVFKGTRVQMQTLIEYLEAGNTIDDFLEGFPTVKNKLFNSWKKPKESFLAA